MPPNPSEVTWVEEKALIIGRAAPEPSRKHIETVCTGAITEDGRLLRLFPITFRYLEENQKYKLWSWAKLEISKDQKDPRKESYRVREGSISVFSRVEGVSERFALLSKGIFPDREALHEEYRRNWSTMGVIEIEFMDLTAALPRKDWETQKPSIKQAHLLVEKKPLAQIPIQMKLKFRCRNNAACRTHRCTLIAWEYMEAFRSFSEQYGSPRAAFEKVKDALIQRYFDASKRSYALLGMHRRYPVWMIGQLYAFDKQLQQFLLT